MRHSPSAALLVAFATSVVTVLTPFPSLPQSKKSAPAQINFLSRDKEIGLGKQLAQQVEHSSKIIDDPVASEYLNQLTQNIAKNSDAKFPIIVRVIDSDEINAFTLPAGYQYVNRGLILATESEAELAGVLAHCVAHTALRSSTVLATKSELTQLASIPAMFYLPYAWNGYTSSQGPNLAIPLTLLKFSRDVERDADFHAVQYLYKAGYNAESYPEFLERALSRPSKGQSIPPVFSTFPPLPKRLKATHEEIARLLPQRDSEIVSTSDFEAIKERLRAWRPKETPATATNPEKPTLRKPAQVPAESPKCSRLP